MDQQIDRYNLYNLSDQLRVLCYSDELLCPSFWRLYFLLRSVSPKFSLYFTLYLGKKTAQPNQHLFDDPASDVILLGYWSCLILVVLS